MFQSWANYFLGGTSSHSNTTNNDCQKAQKQNVNTGVENQCNARLIRASPDGTKVQSQASHNEVLSQETYDDEEWVWVDQPVQHSQQEFEDSNNILENSLVSEYLGKSADILYEIDYIDEKRYCNDELDSYIDKLENYECDLKYAKLGEEPSLTSKALIPLKLSEPNMDESWFITPPHPPCFMPTEETNDLERSPMENLPFQYQHISVHNRLSDTMFNHSRVYHEEISRKNRQKLIAGIGKQLNILQKYLSNNLDKPSENSKIAEKVLTKATKSDLKDNNKCNSRVPAAVQQQDKQALKAKQAQKIQLQKACENIKRGCLPLQNKARELNGRNRRQRRGERSQGATRSCVNNNRKC